MALLYKVYRDISPKSSWQEILKNKRKLSDALTLKGLLNFDPDSFTGLWRRSRS